MAKRPDCPDCGREMKDAVEGARVVASVCDCGQVIPERGVYQAYAPWQLGAMAEDIAERVRSGG